MKTWFVSQFERLLVSFWAWREKSQPADGGPPDVFQPTDNVMRTMSLVMPLRDKTAVGRATAATTVALGIDEIYSGLDNVGTVHMARFAIVENNLLMFSYYDGDFRNYIRDFIVTLGHAFDAIVGLVEDPPPTPCKEHVEAFIQWVHLHDCFQVPDDILDLAPDLTDLRNLSRDVVLRLHENPNVLLGSYRAYPGFSVSEIRARMGVGW